MRTVVVGASSGVGRCIGVGLAKRGAHVALLARRKERLEEAAREAGADAVPVECDVTDEESVNAAIEQAAKQLGGIDAVVYATGIGPLARVEEIDAATWRRAFDTNVIGAALVTNAAIQHLTESHGTAAYLSTVAASFFPPWPGLGAYAVSKAALDKLVEAWRGEHPDVGFTRVVLGDCNAPSELPTTWDHDLAVEMGPIWVERKFIAGTLIDTEHLIDVLNAVLRGGASLSIPSITVIPRP